MSVQVKVCGLTRREDISLAESLGAAYIGLNGYAKSARSVEVDQMAGLLDMISPGKRVIVDVAPQPGKVEKYLEMGFDHFQFHFDLDLSMATVAVWSELVGPERLWLAPRIQGDLHPYPQILMQFADTFLVDAFHKDAYGGTGIAGQNWQQFLDCTILYQHKQWVLAGGLSPDNIEEALTFTQAEVVDVASGVESQPGIKDADKLNRFFAGIKRYDHHRESS